MACACDENRGGLCRKEDDGDINAGEEEEEKTEEEVVGHRGEPDIWQNGLSEEELYGRAARRPMSLYVGTYA